MIEIYGSISQPQLLQPDAMYKMRTILADDHTLIRECLSAILERSPQLQVIAEAASGSEAVRLSHELQPDLVIMDIGMKEVNGIEATRCIVSGSPDTKVLILSMHADRRYVSEALDAGACGFLLKSCTTEEIFAAINMVAANDTYVCDEMRGMVERDAEKRGSDQRQEDVLTSREREVLVLLAQGKSTRGIADLLQISPKTVETHRTHVMKKLKLTNIASLTKYSIRRGLLSLD